MDSKTWANRNVNLGDTVEITLKKDAKFNIESTVVPTYIAPVNNENIPSSKIITGYAVQITDKYICLVPGWDKEEKKMLESGHIGGVNIDWDAIYQND